MHWASKLFSLRVQLLIQKISRWLDKCSIPKINKYILQLTFNGKISEMIILFLGGLSLWSWWWPQCTSQPSAGSKVGRVSVNLLTLDITCYWAQAAECTCVSPGGDTASAGSYSVMAGSTVWGTPGGTQVRLKQIVCGMIWYWMFSLFEATDGK